MTDVGGLTPIEAAGRLASLSPRTAVALDRWKAQRWDEGEPAYGAFRAIGSAIASKRAPPSAAGMKALFAFADRLLTQGSGDVSNMIATGLLEQICTAAHESGFDFSTVDRHLGPEARRYLLAWDKFNDRKMPGLAIR